MATGTVLLPVQSAKLAGAHITTPMVIEGAEGSWALLADATTDEEAIFQFRMPTDYSSAPVLKITYSMASAVADQVVFACAVMALTIDTTDDLDTAAFDTVNTGTADTVPGAAGRLGEVSITLTNADSAAAADLVLLRISRDANNGSDDATGDAELRAISLEYTTA